MKKKFKSIIAIFILIIMFISTILGFFVQAFALERMSDDHIIDGYEINEPFFVHTPVIAPVIIRDEENNDIPNGGHLTTQLVNENFSTDYELILDNEYILHWASLEHRGIKGYGDSGESPSKYDKYTQDKWMKFPFEVLYDGTFYEVHNEDNRTAEERESDHDCDTPYVNYTDWIRIRRPANWDDTVDNHWIDTPIYIPSYAREMGESGNEGKIYFKVEAINVDGEISDHWEEYQEEANTDFDLVLAPNGAKYVARFGLSVQTSGILYDFTITGTDNSNVFVGDSFIRRNEISFALNKAEKKAGVKNRFGRTNIRYLLDGSLTNAWNNKNTLPLTDSKSKQFSSMGAAWKGTTISYSFKTIANLWNDEGIKDRVYIKPSFRYVDNNGNETENIKIYYDNPDGSGTYIEYGSVRDKTESNFKRSYIGSPQIKGAYYKEVPVIGNQYGYWGEFTTEKYNEKNGTNLSENNYLNKKNLSYCLSQIYINPVLRLYSGEYEQLKWNTKDNPSQHNSLFRTYKDVDRDGGVDPTWGNIVEMQWEDHNNKRRVTTDERFRMSMQTWYGQYYIPENLYIVNLNENPTFTTLDEYMENAHNMLGIYAYDDPIFEDSGYLILNFQIMTYNKGNPHLLYNTNVDAGNMWKTEGYKLDKDADDPTPIIKYKYGDILSIDLGRDTDDKYAPAIQNIN